MSGERKRPLIYSIRRFLSPKLSATEIGYRINLAREMSVELKNDKQWQDWITKIYLFGSLVYGEPKRISDIDIGVFTNQNYFFESDFWFTMVEINDFARDFLSRRGIKSIKMSCCICPQGWMDEPEKYKVRKLEVMYEIVKRGIKII